MLNARVLTLPRDTHCHEHAHHQVVIGLRGHAELDVEGLGVALDTGQACLVPTQARHDFQGNDRNHVLVIDLDRDDPALSDPRHGEYERLAPLFDHPQTVTMDQQLCNMIQVCAAELNQSPDNAALHGHLAAGIMHCLSNRLGLPCTSTGRSRHALSPEHLRDWILRHLHLKITIRDLAAEACLSVSRFHEVFRDLTGISPHQFVIQVRLERVVELLRYSHLPLAEVAFRTGFSSQGALTNAMKKYRGVTPSTLRSRDRTR